MFHKALRSLTSGLEQQLGALGTIPSCLRGESQSFPNSQADDRGSGLPVDGHADSGSLVRVKLRFQVRFMVRVGRRLSSGLVAFAALMALLEPMRAQQVPVIETTLPNGMRLLMVERHDEPTVSGAWVAHVGSSNERPGITGIAHLFEHMMFKGTPTIGTKDYQKDLDIIAAQERVREEMRREEAKLRAAYRRGDVDDLQKIENRSDRFKALDKEFQELIEQQRQILVKNEFDRVYTTAGASGMNAFTSEDMTAYFITVPANKLALWLWIESERLLRPVFRAF